MAPARPGLQCLHRHRRHAGRRPLGPGPGSARGAPCEDDLYERHALGDSLPERLPRDLLAALDGLAKDAVLREAVGPAFCAQFLALKHDEWAAWSQQVSGWELQRYAAAP